MSNYTKSTNFATKDNLTPGDPLKVVRGTEIDTEYNNIATAIATKTDNASAAITGGTIDGATVGATTPASGAFTTLAASGTTTLAGALVGAVTQAAFNTVSTTLNLGGAATAVNLGAATGTATVNNTTLAAKAITASTTLAVTGTSTLTGAVTATAGVSGPITSSSVSITGGSITGITDLAVADGGTGASTAATALNNLLPSQTGNASKYLQTDGTNASWDAVSLSTADITGTLGAANGGTGVSNNAAMTVTGSGNFAYTRTLTGTTNVTFPTTGTLATLAGTETLTNKTLTSPILTTPTLGVATATSLQGIIGNVTPAAGSFTTLGASSTATLNTLSSSGATLTGGTINGMTVGATTASSGAFTTVTASTAIGTASGGTGLGGATPFTANGVVFASSASALSTGSALVFDGTNLGIGVTPTAALDVLGSFFNGGQSRTNLVTKTFGFRVPHFLTATNPMNVIGGLSTTSVNFVYIGGSDSNIGGTAATDLYFYTAANNTTANGTLRYTIDSAGNSIWSPSGTEGMRLTSTGLGIGTSSPSQKLDVSGNINVSGTGTSNFTSTATSPVQINGTSIPTLTINNSTTPVETQIRSTTTEGFIRTATNHPLLFGTNATEKMRIDTAGNVGIGTTSPAQKLHVLSASATATVAKFSATNYGNLGTTYIEIGTEFGDGCSRIGSSNPVNNQSILVFETMTATSGVYAERVRIDNTGNLLVGTTSINPADGNVAGSQLSNLGSLQASASSATPAIFNRKTDDGNLVGLLQDGTVEGTISVSGTTVSYNGGNLSRWAQMLTKPELFKGTVMSNLDEMNVYTKDGQPVANEQLNKVKVSDLEGDANVAGVFVNWTHDDAHNVDEINMAMTGDMIIRIAQGTTVVRGDLLMSAGDGTAKPQGDDIVRSKTVAKVTSNHVTCTYADGSYCVPCVLMAC